MSVLSIIVLLSLYGVYVSPNSTFSVVVEFAVSLLEAVELALLLLEVVELAMLLLGVLELAESLL